MHIAARISVLPFNQIRTENDPRWKTQNQRWLMRPDLSANPKQQLKKMPRNETLKGGALVLAAIAACSSANAQNYAPPVGTTPATPSAGLVNDYLRKQSDAFKPWDFGGQFRVRYELKNNFATPGNPPAVVGGDPGALDFRDKGGNPHN